MNNKATIKSQGDLVEFIRNLHNEAYLLCKDTFGNYFDNSGNIGIFCQSDEEYNYLVSLRDELCEFSDNPLLKYYTLKKPIHISSNSNIPEAVYTHLYIRKPDPSPYGKHLGDIDFIMDENEYKRLLDEFKVSPEKFSNASLYIYNNREMIELSSHSEGVLVYVSTKEIAEGMRIKKVNS